MRIANMGHRADLVQEIDVTNAEEAVDIERQLEEKFWTIVDRDGLSNTSSDMWTALAELVHQASNHDRIEQVPHYAPLMGAFVDPTGRYASAEMRANIGAMGDAIVRTMVVDSFKEFIQEEPDDVAALVIKRLWSMGVTFQYTIAEIARIKDMLSQGNE